VCVCMCVCVYILDRVNSRAVYDIDEPDDVHLQRGSTGERLEWG